MQLKYEYIMCIMWIIFINMMRCMVMPGQRDHIMRFTGNLLHRAGRNSRTWQTGRYFVAKLWAVDAMNFLCHNINYLVIQI